MMRRRFAVSAKSASVSTPTITSEPRADGSASITSHKCTANLTTRTPRPTTSPSKIGTTSQRLNEITLSITRWIDVITATGKD